MTIREMYMNMIDVLENTNAEIDRVALKEAIEDRIAKYDAQAEKRKNAERKPSAKQLAAREYDAKLMESIGEVFAEALDITPSKASTLLNKMAAAGLVEKGEVKGEKGKQVGYKRA